MTNESTETQIALLKQWRTQVEAHMVATDAAVKALEDERNHALKWGIITLGASVVGMGVWIWNFIVGHLR